MGIKFPILINFKNIANKSNNKLIEENIYFDKLFSIIPGELFGNNLYQNTIHFV